MRSFSVIFPKMKIENWELEWPSPRSQQTGLVHFLCCVPAWNRRAIVIANPTLSKSLCRWQSSALGKALDLAALSILTDPHRAHIRPDRKSVV